MSRHRLRTSPRVLELLIFFTTLTQHKDREAVRVQHEVSRSGNQFLNAEQQRVFHVRAEAYADLALSYAKDHPGGHDQSAVGAGMLMIQTAEHATTQLRDDLDLAQGHPDDGVYAIGRATIAAFTWLKVTHGYAESERRFRRAVNAVRSLPAADAPRQPAAAR
ncbi:hypothetical protein [Amycolatopsis australiensis]|uniref:Uncharacterized protein n=1 Tax=Amycolatopsis australiensis TaxID=546364 RepID=A0A1K1LQI4_9PSEU|nr:hypothetical protein [Amycolatopsis australiensis]SFW13107.1 hypothetical protein SAMN04489730_0138 [Amycolatopsis australiensis]